MRFLTTLFTALLALLAPATAEASIVDSWTAYFSYYEATDAVEADGVVYAVMSGNLLSYDTETTEVRTYDRLNSDLSSKGIVHIGYSATQHTLVILYADGNIDLLDTRKGRMTNLPQFKDNPDTDFAINNLKVSADWAFVCTGEGVVAIDLKRRVIQGRYAVGASTSAIDFDGYLYVTSDSGAKRIRLNDNLLDNSRWEKIFDLPIADVDASDEWVYLTVPYNNQTRDTDKFGTWGIRRGTTEMQFLTTGWGRQVRHDYGRTIIHGHDRIIEFDDQNSPTTPRLGVDPTKYHAISPASDGGYWVALTGSGLQHYELTQGTNEFRADGSPIVGNGPSHEIPFFLRFEGDRLFMAAGRLDADNDNNHNPYHASWMDNDGTWHDFETPQVGGPWLRKNHDFEDATTISQDPRDPSHHFVTSGRQGIFEYRDGKIVAQHTHGNSPMESCSGSKSYDYVRCTAGVFDSEGNFFVSNTSVDTTIWCLRHDGRWIPFYNSETAGLTNFENAIIDRKGRLWVTQRRYANGVRGGFLCIDHNGTLDNPNDDVYTYRSTFINEDGTSFLTQSAYCIAEDKTGRIWMGTDAGLIVCDDPDQWSKSDFLITQVKVPRNDGTNYADYLLDGAVVTAIAVDGADRKWIGTSGDGVYLVSADGTVILHHFTTVNSPLVSDNVWSIACHPTNGEVFIGTERGLMSFHSDASETHDTLERDNLRVYPNPVRPDYSGPVVLDGLVFDSDVKVVSTDGHTVAAGTSIGGTFTWDGRGPSGQRVASGIYYFMIATPDGRETTVAKVAVVR